MIPKSLNKGDLEYGKELEYKILVGDDSNVWSKRIAKNIQKPFVAKESTQNNAVDEFQADHYVLVTIDNDSGDGLETLKAIRKLNPNVPIIYTSMMPDDEEWLEKSGIARYGANVHLTADIASPKVNAIISEYLGVGGIKDDTKKSE